MRRIGLIGIMALAAFAAVPPLATGEPLFAAGRPAVLEFDQDKATAVASVKHELAPFDVLQLEVNVSSADDARDSSPVRMEPDGETVARSSAVLQLEHGLSRRSVSQLRPPGVTSPRSRSHRRMLATQLRGHGRDWHRQRQA